MHNRQKKVIFSAGGVFSFACVLIVATAMGTRFWVKATVLCTTGAQLVNATGPELDKFIGSVNYGLFQGQRLKQCGLGGRPFSFSFFPDLVDVIPVSLHGSVLFFCAVLILFSSLCSAFFMYNAFGSPYETLHGPLGLYMWNMSSRFADVYFCRMKPMNTTACLVTGGGFPPSNLVNVLGTVVLF
ncbi:clarin-1 isoform X2 [Electrophorus electricus]|uniref:clarin-1 isoform X2 n=1 Tax=Electrophorus electricus TaxID=8005 RepID=UPI0015CFE81E|nr:clarin-1 isoform X2 [Electrophorus electricus]